MIRTILRRTLLGANLIPQYEVVGVREPQRQVRVDLAGMGPPVDVTDNTVAVSLSPLRIAVALPAEHARIVAGIDRARLTFREQDSSRHLGMIRLTLEEMKPLGLDVLCIFRTAGCVNRCVPRWKALLYDQYRSRSARRRKVQYNHQMSRRDLQSFFVFYTRPRPVALVTVHTGHTGNIFPMDLIGPTTAPWFLLALHSTAPSVERIRTVRHLTVSYIPVELASVVYELGRNHRVADIDWNGLPLPIRSSPLNGWPIPRAALTVSELSVEDVYDMGSHTLFVTRVVAEERLAEGLRMCHIQGFYHDYLRRRGEPFGTEARPASMHGT